MDNTSTGAIKNTHVGSWDFVKSLLRGAGQVMWQDSAWTGLFFFLGIFWGAYAEGLPLVAWGALLGVIVSTVTGALLKLPATDEKQGLFGFNGVLVGAACFTFLGDSVWVWLVLIMASAMTTWVMVGFNRLLSPAGVPSFTFPFVFTTWIFMLASYAFSGMPITGLSTPTLPLQTTFQGTLSIEFWDLVIYWLKGIAQVFLINNWVTGIFFIIGLALCSRWAALWAMIASALSLFIALVYGAHPAAIYNGLFGYSPVLTGIGLATVYYSVGFKTGLWALVGIIATVFIQAAMDVIFTPYGLPTFTGPFCVTTWLFLLPKIDFTTKN